MRDGSKSFVIAGDIGGTKTVIGLFSKGKRRPRAKVVKTYQSNEAKGLEEILESFVAENGKKILAACFGVAGPVFGTTSQITNLPWYISVSRVSKRFGWEKVAIVNDVLAAAMAIPFLLSDELYVLNKDVKRKKGNIGLIAPGTGLGIAFLIHTRDGYVGVPSEGGHSDFAPSNKKQADLWQYLHNRFGHVSIERVLSGPGLVNIYQWLISSRRYNEPVWLKKSLISQNPAAAITLAATERNNPLCRACLKIFCEILGSVCGDMALTFMTEGGLYLGGGIPAKILPAIIEGPFWKSFTSKGRFKGILEKIPVRVVLNEKAPLLGAAQMAMELCEEDPLT